MVEWLDCRVGRWHTGGVAVAGVGDSRNYGWHALGRLWLFGRFNCAGAIAALGGCAAAVILFHTPPVPTLLLVVPLYLVQMVVEVIVLGRAFFPRG